VSNQARVGLFAAISIIIFIVGLYFLKGSNILTQKHYYYALYDRVDGLYKSNLVVINGFEVGRVTDMKFDNASQKIVVELEVKEDLKIPANSTAILYSVDFLGQKSVKILMGDSGKILQDGDTINTEFKKEFMEEIGANINPIMDQIGNLTGNVDTALFDIRYLFNKKNPAGIYHTLETLNKTLETVNTTVAEMNVIIHNQSGNLQKTVANVESITANLSKNNENISKTLSNVAAFSDTLREMEVAVTIARLNATLAQLDQLMKEINAGEGSAGLLIKDPKLYNNLEASSANLNKLLLDLKENPHRYVTFALFGGKKKEDKKQEKAASKK